MTAALRLAPLTPDFRARLAEVGSLLAADATEALNTGDGRVYAAMRYMLNAPSKRLRPYLVLASAQVCGASEASARRVALAVEMLHTYSLIHDDLPAMDNSDTRRGQASCHKAFDEATAVLAGDALLTLAFEVLADAKTHEDARIRLALVTVLAQASGANGMIAGQMLDILAETTPCTLDQIIDLQHKKTGALFRFCCEAGAILAGADAAVRVALAEFARGFGLAFQIMDDILDATGDAVTLGKPVGQDAIAGKATFVSLLGLDGARQAARAYAKEAHAALQAFGQKADSLRQALDFVLERSH